MAVLIGGLIGLLQVGFLVLLLAFLLIRRVYDRRQAAAFEAGKGTLAAPLREFKVPPGLRWYEDGARVQ